MPIGDEDDLFNEWMERHGMGTSSGPENPFSPAENEPDESWETYLIREGLENGELMVESPRSVEDVKATITEAILEGVKDSSIAYTLLNNSLKLVDWQSVYDDVEHAAYGDDGGEQNGDYFDNEDDDDDWDDWDDDPPDDDQILDSDDPDDVDDYDPLVSPQWWPGEPGPENRFPDGPMPRSEE